MRSGILLVFVALLGLSLAACSGRQPPDNRVEALEITRVTRDVDLTTSLAKEKVIMVVENKGKKSCTYVLYTVEPLVANNLAYISAEIQEKGTEGILAYVTKEQRPLSQCEEAAVYRLAIPSVAPGASITLQVEVIFYKAIEPFPSEVTQNEKQLVMYTGNSYLYLPYVSLTQSSNFKLPSSKIESFSRVTPTNSAEDTLTYGPYSDISPFSFSKIAIHYENNGPFLTVVELQRVIEVSHWGNIAVEEHVHIMHSGAVLKGSFSRYDYQRNPNSGPSSVKGYITLLPAAARDIYYRDEIGNISTSSIRDEDDYVSFELKPRFPLFGGWQTRYYYGYNLPSYEYLYHHGNQYLLKMRLLDHVVDDQFIQRLTVKIILPEGAKNLDFRPPSYDVEEGSQEVKLTYLDTMGRPVIVARASNLVEQHVQDFHLYYSFQSVMLLQEPLLIVAALLIFFLCVIVIVRLDFSITEDAALLARQQAQVLIEGIQQSHDRRAALVSRYRSIITTFKESKDVGTFKSRKKSYDDEYKRYSDEVAGKLKELQTGDPESASKVQEVQKKMAEVKMLLDDCCLLADKVVKETIKRQPYVDQSKVADSKIDKILEDVGIVMQAL